MFNEPAKAAMNTHLMLRRLTLFSFLLFAGFVSRAQENIREFTAGNIHEIKTIEPDSVNFSDLGETGKAIGDARIVLLGEQDHGDAPTFLAKTRLIKYLHEKKGFDVLVFESDFWALNQVWDRLPVNGFSIDSIRNNTYGIWARCQQVQPLYNYIEASYKSGSPLIISGMDCRHALPYSKAHYLTQFDSLVLQRTQHVSVLDLQRFKTILKSLVEEEYSSETGKQGQHFFLSTLDTILATAPLDKFWKQEIRNLKAFAKASWKGAVVGDYPERDVQMADNLNWLFHEKYAGKKIIVWAHNIHIARNLASEHRKIYYYNRTMGNQLHEALKDTVYSLGFTSRTGKAGRIPFKPYKIEVPKGECFENWVYAKSLKYGFIDFRKYTGNEEFKMQGIHHWEIKARWTHIFDGVFYIEQMYPCDKTG